MDEAGVLVRPDEQHEAWPSRVFSTATKLRDRRLSLFSRSISKARPRKSIRCTRCLLPARAV